VLREETERIEIIEAGIGVLVGSDQEKIVKEFCKMVHSLDVSSRGCVHNIYGVPGVSNTILEKFKIFSLNLCR
jgi:UDP-N-acetylglucosamine 2-epimerase